MRSDSLSTLICHDRDDHYLLSQASLLRPFVVPGLGLYFLAVFQANVSHSWLRPLLQSSLLVRSAQKERCMSHSCVFFFRFFFFFKKKSYLLLHFDKKLASFIIACVVNFLGQVLRCFNWVMTNDAAIVFIAKRGTVLGVGRCSSHHQCAGNILSRLLPCFIHCGGSRYFASPVCI